MLRFVFLMLLTYPFLSVANAKLKPFGSDGCSSFPDGTIEHKNLWLACCTAHDLAYWQGGTFKQREQADVDLKECVAKVGEKEIAVLMLAGVRVGGTPFLPTSFRWGYGWPYPKFYGELTEQERMQVESRLAELNTEKNN
ncbi:MULTISPECIES: hypothetical protein [unclassified Pseudoalteromonas]|uniref:hypothetical protein n=1 Tax=unclassified Pseudoalteromonas TaxID=194690 RepID=UPI00201DE71A|nr:MULTISPECIES: hypothetical protein [unclassified Pseudoalteromonas]